MPAETIRVITTSEAHLNALLAAVGAIQLRMAFESRVVIEQAKGMLAERLGVSLDEASAFLRSAARSQGVNLNQLAAEVVRSPETLIGVAAR